MDPDGTCIVDRVNAYQAADALSGEVVRDVSFDLPGSGAIEVIFDGT